MASAAGSLSEPTVLAHAKQRLFPDAAEPDTYAVVDTQFSTECWLEETVIEQSVREALAPFNRVRMGQGNPDLVGVRTLEDDLVAVERQGEAPPLIVVEAKGHDRAGGVDTQRGIVQAYDRLGEANVAYLAAPAVAISQTDRTLARELNVGVLGVAATGSVEPLEVPRVVGHRNTSAAMAILIQASAQGVADRSFGLNHPKNYLGYPLALYADGPTNELLAEYDVVGAFDQARRGAAFLGLVEEQPAGVVLTSLGREVVRFATARYGDVEAALAEFRTWYGSSKRFYDAAPRWGELARRVVFAYPATELLVSELQGMHEMGHATPTLVDLVVALHQSDPTFAVELFVRGEEGVRRRVLTGDGELRRDALTDGNVYHSPTVYQLKAMLYHAGILTERGTEPDGLDPTADVWALRDVV